MALFFTDAVKCGLLARVIVTQQCTRVEERRCGISTRLSEMISEERASSCSHRWIVGVFIGFNGR